MNQYAFEFPNLATATITLSVAAIASWLMLGWLKPSSHRLHRAVWLAVLLNGVILIRYSLDLPVLDHGSMSAVAKPAAMVDQSEDGGVDVSPGGELSNADRHPVAGLVVDRQPAEGQTNGSYTAQQPFGSAVVTDSADGAANTSELISFGQSSAGSALRSVSPWLPYFVWAWLGGVVGISLLLLGRYLAFLHSLTNAQPAKRVWRQEVGRLCDQLGIRRRPQLLVHRHLGPMMAITPRGAQLIVPHGFWQQLSGGQRRAVLQHELAHYRRGDIWKSMVVTAMAIPHWFNPFSWLAVRQFNQAAEWACDEAVGQQNELERTGFARALLSLSTGNHTFLVGVSGTGNSDLKARVRRLLATPSRDTLLRRLMLGGLISAIILLGWVNLRLVTASAPLETNLLVGAVQEDQPEQADRRIADLADKLSASDDPLVQQMAAAIKTPAGRVALANRLAAVEEQLRQEAARDLVPEYIAKGLTGDTLSALTAEVDQAQSDLDKLSVALADLRSSMVDTTPADKMLIRLFDRQNSAAVLYFSQLRQQMRPGRQMIMRRLGRFLADDGSGKLVVRESAREELIRQFSQLDDVDKFGDFVAQELRHWADEIAPLDDMHRQIKENLVKPDAAARVMAQFYGQGSLREGVEQYFEFMERIFVDGPEGLTVADDQRDKVMQAMEVSRQLKEKIARLREPLKQVAASIQETGQAEKLAKRFVSSDFGITVLAKDINIGSAAPTAIIERIKNDVLEEVDGKLTVREDKQQDVINFAREMLRNNRRLRRHAQVLTTHLENLDDGPLKDICSSVAGRLIVLEKIKEHMATQQFDAWPVWLNQHFESAAQELTIRDQSRQMIESLLQETQQINQELRKDDF